MLGLLFLDFKNIPFIFNIEELEELYHCNVLEVYYLKIIFHFIKMTFKNLPKM